VPGRTLQKKRQNARVTLQEDLGKAMHAELGSQPLKMTWRTISVGKVRWLEGVPVHSLKVRL
jgi:hypothetical protein